MAFGWLVSLDGTGRTYETRTVQTTMKKHLPPRQAGRELQCSAECIAR